MLLMKRIFFDSIRSGRKTTTLRFWSRRQLRRDSVHTVPGLGRVRIEEVKCVRPEDLTDADAQADGFESLVELQKALTRLYPRARRKGRKLYHVHFQLLP